MHHARTHTHAQHRAEHLVVVARLNVLQRHREEGPVHRCKRVGVQGQQLRARVGPAVAVHGGEHRHRRRRLVGGRVQDLPQCALELRRRHRRAVGPRDVHQVEAGPAEHQHAQRLAGLGHGRLDDDVLAPLRHARGGEHMPKLRHVQREGPHHEPDGGVHGVVAERDLEPARDEAHHGIEPRRLGLDVEALGGHLAGLERAQEAQRVVDEVGRSRGRVLLLRARVVLEKQLRVVVDRQRAPVRNVGVEPPAVDVRRVRVGRVAGHQCSMQFGAGAGQELGGGLSGLRVLRRRHDGL
jgi:hypothetical protein